MTFPSILRTASHMAHGYISQDVGPYVRIDCETGHSHYASQADFQAAVELAGRRRLARRAAAGVTTPSKALSALLRAAATPNHTDTRGSAPQESVR